MKSKIVPLLVGLMLSTIMFGQKAESPLKIILKLDDFPAHLETSTKVLDYLFEKDIKAGLGVIAANLNDSSTNILRHYINRKSKGKTNLFEIWHHGLYHEKFPDFTYEEQKARFEKGDSIDWVFRCMLSVHQEIARIVILRELFQRIQTIMC